MIIELTMNSLLYHIVAMNVSETLVHAKDSKISTQPRGHIQLISDQSRRYFETIMRLYYLRHGFAVPDGHMSHALVLLSYQGLTMRQTVSPPGSSPTSVNMPLEEARSTLVLGTKGLDEQGANYYLPLAVLRVIQNEMWPEDRNLLQQYIKQREEDEETRQQRETYMRSQYPVGLNTLTRRSDGRRLDRLQKGFVTLAKEKAQTPASSFVSHYGNIYESSS